MFTTAPAVPSARITVQPYAGFGEYLQLDPVSGRLEPTPMAMQAPGGVYGELDGVRVVFYRGPGGLALRVGDRVIDLEDHAAAVVWDGGPGGGRTRFAVTVAGETVSELWYPAVPADFDVGRLVRDVCADPERRELIFAR